MHIIITRYIYIYIYIYIQIFVVNVNDVLITIDIFNTGVKEREIKQI